MTAARLSQEEWGMINFSALVDSELVPWRVLLSQGCSCTVACKSGFTDWHCVVISGRDALPLVFATFLLIVLPFSQHCCEHKRLKATNGARATQLNLHHHKLCQLPPQCGSAAVVSPFLVCPMGGTVWPACGCTLDPNAWCTETRWGLWCTEMTWDPGLGQQDPDMFASDYWSLLVGQD